MHPHNIGAERALKLITQAKLNSKVRDPNYENTKSGDEPRGRNDEKRQRDPEKTKKADKRDGENPPEQRASVLLE